MKVLPTIAGLNTFIPNPPKTILPKQIAIIAPTATIQNGIVGGSVRAKSVPVTKTAIETLPNFFLRINKNSVKKANKFEISIMAKTRHPNRKIENKMIGIRA